MKLKSILFDHLVGEREQRWRHVEAERPRGFGVDTSSNFDACMTGRSAGFAPLRMRPA